MKTYRIEVDDKIWSYLQQHAEPFIDTPNSVLNKLLFGTGAADCENESVFKVPSVSVKGSPDSLAYILEVLYEIEANGFSRTEATNRIAKKSGLTSQTITNKYCRQLNKRAHEIDELLSEPGYNQFKQLLKSKFMDHHAVIDTYFESLALLNAD